ncbi:hypothetical protein MMC18_001842 [Xylographa bjoerkii]|nr:hypothetical protein [Xylographa bjoerkii]
MAARSIHIWTTVQIDHAICLEIHGVLGPRQIADKLNAIFGGTKTYSTVKYLLSNMAGRLSPSEAARKGGVAVVHEKWRYWQSRGMHHLDVQQILMVHGLFAEEVPEEGDEDEEEEDDDEMEDAGSERDSGVGA